MATSRPQEVRIMAILSTVTRRALVTPAASRALAATQPRLDARRWMGGDGHDDHEHLVFEGPYNPWVIGGWITFIVGGGAGVIVQGMRHQQYKQGYWK